jgi:hypothetical protein
MRADCFWSTSRGSGRMDTTLPFDELRRRSLINATARAADGAADFPDRIRTPLPTMPH